MRPTITLTGDQLYHPGVSGLALYRCFGLDGTLMYIGQTNNLDHRFSYHRWDTAWWHAVETITVQRYRSRAVLRQDELRAIMIEQPYFNQHGKGRRQQLAFALSERCAGLPLWSDGNTFGVVSRDV